MIFSCADLAVPSTIMQHVVRVESSGNPYAIGVVGGKLQRQPRNLSEAVSTAQMLEQKGYNFSLGLAQVNRYNLKKYGLHSYEAAFQICPNIKAGSLILKECYDRSRDWGKSFSCYYSGNFTTGYRHGYVQKIFASMGKQTTGLQLIPVKADTPKTRGYFSYSRQPETHRETKADPAYSTSNNNFVISPTKSNEAAEHVVPTPRQDNAFVF